MAGSRPACTGGHEALRSLVKGTCPYPRRMPCIAPSHLGPATLVGIPPSHPRLQYFNLPPAAALPTASALISWWLPPGCSTSRSGQSGPRAWLAPPRPQPAPTAPGLSTPGNSPMTSSRWRRCGGFRGRDSVCLCIRCTLNPSPGGRESSRDRLTGWHPEPLTPAAARLPGQRLHCAAAELQPVRPRMARHTRQHASAASPSGHAGQACGGCGRGQVGARCGPGGLARRGVGHPGGAPRPLDGAPESAG